MAKELIAFRATPQELRLLRHDGINPNRFAREAFRAALDRHGQQKRGERLAEARRWVAEAQKKHPLDISVVELIRQDRESH